MFLIVLSSEVLAGGFVARARRPLGPKDATARDGRSVRGLRNAGLRRSFQSVEPKARWSFYG